MLFDIEEENDDTTSKDAEEPLSPLHLTVWASTIGFAIQTVPFIAEVSQVGISNPSFDAWVGIIFLAVFSTVLSYVWFADGIRTIGAGPASMYVYLVPIFGIFSGWLLLDEKLGSIPSNFICSNRIWFIDFSV